MHVLLSSQQRKLYELLRMSTCQHQSMEQGRAKIEIRQKHFNFLIMCASLFLKHSCELCKIDLKVASIPPFWWTTSLFAFLTGPYKSLGYKGYLHVNFQIIYQLATAKCGF